MRKSDDPLLSEVRRYIQKYYATIHSMIYTGTLHKPQKEPLPVFEVVYTKDFTFRVFVNICIDNYQTIGVFLLDLLRDYHEYRKNIVKKSRTAEVFDDKRNMTPLGVLKHLRCIKDGGECGEFRVLVPDEPDQQLANMVLIGGQSGMKNVSKGHFGQTVADYRVNMANNHKIRTALQAVVLTDNAQAGNFADHSLFKFGFAYMKYKAMQMEQLLAHLVQVQSNVQAAATEQAKIAVIEQEMNDSYALLAHLLGIVNQLRTRPVQQPQQALSVATELQNVTEEIQKLQQTFTILQKLLEEIKNRPPAPPSGTTDAVLQARIAELEAEVTKLRPVEKGSKTFYITKNSAGFQQTFAPIDPKQSILDSMSSDSARQAVNVFAKFKKLGIPRAHIEIKLRGYPGVDVADEPKIIQYLFDVDDSSSKPKKTEAARAVVPAASELFISSIVNDQPFLLHQTLIPPNSVLPVGTGGGRTGKLREVYERNIELVKYEPDETADPMSDVVRRNRLLKDLSDNLDIIRMIQKKETDKILNDANIFKRLISNVGIIMNANKILDASKIDTNEDKKIPTPLQQLESDSIEIKDKKYVQQLLGQMKAVENERKAMAKANTIDMVRNYMTSPVLIKLYRNAFKFAVKDEEQEIDEKMKQANAPKTRPVPMITNMFNFVMGKVTKNPVSFWTSLSMSENDIYECLQIVSDASNFEILYSKLLGVPKEDGLRKLRSMIDQTRRELPLKGIDKEITESGTFTDKEQVAIKHNVNSILEFTKVVYGFTGAPFLVGNDETIVVSIDDFVKLLLLFVSSFIKFVLSLPPAQQNRIREAYKGLIPKLRQNRYASFGRSHMKRRQKLRNRLRNRHALY